MIVKMVAKITLLEISKTVDNYVGKQLIKQAIYRY